MNGNGAQRLELGEGCKRALHVVRDDRFTAVRELRQARSEIHCIASDGVIAMGRAARRRGDNFSTRDADVCDERAVELHGQRGHCSVDVDGRAKRPLDVVAIRDRRAEHAHHGIADMLVDCAAPTRDHRIRALEETRQQSMRLLRVQRAGKARVAGEVGEDDRHLPTFARRHCSGCSDNTRAAVRAEPRTCRQRFPAFAAHFTDGAHRRLFCHGTERPSPGRQASNFVMLTSGTIPAPAKEKNR